MEYLWFGLNILYNFGFFTKLSSFHFSSLLSMMRRCILNGEGHSAILVGPPASGKTTVNGFSFIYIILVTTQQSYLIRVIS